MVGVEVMVGVRVSVGVGVRVFVAVGVRVLVDVWVGNQLYEIGVMYRYEKPTQADGFINSFKLE